MTEEVPAHVMAAFDQAHKETSEALDKIIAAHREFSTDERGRLVSIMSQIDAAMVDPTGAARLLAIAVDRLARMGKQ